MKVLTNVDKCEMNIYVIFTVCSKLLLGFIEGSYRKFFYNSKATTCYLFQFCLLVAMIGFDEHVLVTKVVTVHVWNLCFEHFSSVNVTGIFAACLNICDALIYDHKVYLFLCENYDDLDTNPIIIATCLKLTKC